MLSGVLVIGRRFFRESEPYSKRERGIVRSVGAVTECGAELETRPTVPNAFGLEILETRPVHPHVFLVTWSAANFGLGNHMRFLTFTGVVGPLVSTWSSNLRRTRRNSPPGTGNQSANSIIPCRGAVGVIELPNERAVFQRHERPRVGKVRLDDAGACVAILAVAIGADNAVKAKRRRGSAPGRPMRASEAAVRERVGDREIRNEIGLENQEGGPVGAIAIIACYHMLD